VTDRLRPLWDFDDLDVSEDRFQAQLGEEASAEGRAEVLTQIARVHGLRGEFDEGERFIEQAEIVAGSSAVARARIDLERGRLRRSSGKVEAALPLFVSAFAVALDAGEEFIAVDAAHMAALASPDREGMLVWTQRGIDLAEPAEPAVRHWLGSLLNNLGWAYYDAGEYAQALEPFQRALVERERSPENASAIALARYAVAKSLRALGRPRDALPLLEQAATWAESAGSPDGWYHEELAETYVALDREADAREHAEKALALLADADPEFEPDGERAVRLRGIAGEAASDADS
jgi:tetratricopeptide (TPR) repeat protein